MLLVRNVLWTVIVIFSACSSIKKLTSRYVFVTFSNAFVGAVACAMCKKITVLNVLFGACSIGAKEKSIVITVLLCTGSNSYPYANIMLTAEANVERSHNLCILCLRGTLKHHDNLG